MRKIFLFALCTILACTLFAANCASTRPVSADYKNGRVTFKLTWTGCDNKTHCNQVWVFIDDQEVRSGLPYGAWEPATITSVYSLTPAIVSSQTVSGNKQGLWITGSNGTTATVTLQLDKSKMPAQYKWCVFATDYPPNAISYLNGVYTLRGTKPFVINGTTVDSKTYSAGIINSITDASGCPGWIERNVPTTSEICKTGLTLVGGYCRDLAADDAVAIICSSQELEVQKGLSTKVNPMTVTNAACPTDWRLPTADELRCMWTNRVTIPNMTSYMFVGTGVAADRDTDCGCIGYTLYGITTVFTGTCGGVPWSDGEICGCAKNSTTDYCAIHDYRAKCVR